MVDKSLKLMTDELFSIKKRLDRPVVLVGLMGAGKSTIGRRLANALECSFIDADDEIEAAAQMTISEIFAQFGEIHFRDGERRVLARLINSDYRVIATGGGAFINEKTRSLILEKTVAIWINCDVATLVERTARKDSRPLLKNGNPQKILSRLYEERAEMYAQAPVHVTSDKGPHEHTVVKILEALDKWL